MSKNLNAIFKSYAENVVIPRSSSSSVFESASRSYKASNESYSFALDESDVSKREVGTELYRPPKNELRELIGKTYKYSEHIGMHPDFSELEEGGEEYHYIVSVFLDIKGSTKLATKLPLDDVKFIKNGTMVTAIDIFQAFDGHIHRLQGDAVFAFFGRKDMSKSQAIIDALNASTCIQFFFKNTLSPMFEDYGLPTIKIRIGIDFGDDGDVMWSKYGIKNTTEITTTSLHTDLAAKLQNRAPAMGIMIGNNIVSYLDLPHEFISKKTYTSDKETKTDDYVLKTNDFSYRMWKFEWEKYFNKSILFSDRFATTPYKSPNHFLFKCYHDDGSKNEIYTTEYKPNCTVIPKGYNLKFEVQILTSLRYDTIIWTVHNRGLEAEKAEQESKDGENPLTFEMVKYRNKKVCYQSTKYKGHHYMRCTLKYQGRVIANDYFGVFIR